MLLNPTKTSFNYKLRGERPFGCNFCGKRFGQQTNLDRHCRIKHKSDRNTNNLLNIHALSQLSYAQKMVQIQRLQARAQNLGKMTNSPTGQNTQNSREAESDEEEDEDEEEMNIDEEYVDIEQNSDDEKKTIKSKISEVA